GQAGPQPGADEPAGEQVRASGGQRFAVGHLGVGQLRVGADGAGGERRRCPTVDGDVFTAEDPGVGHIEPGPAAVGYPAVHVGDQHAPAAGQVVQVRPDPDAGDGGHRRRPPRRRRASSRAAASPHPSRPRSGWRPNPVVYRLVPNDQRPNWPVVSRGAGAGVSRLSCPSSGRTGRWRPIARPGPANSRSVKAGLSRCRYSSIRPAPPTVTCRTGCRAAVTIAWATTGGSYTGGIGRGSTPSRERACVNSGVLIEDG